jgi:hypothetical protein
MLWNGQCLQVEGFIMIRGFPKETIIEIKNILLLLMASEYLSVI